MSLSIGKKMLALAADGTFSRNDFKTAVLDMVDGKGATAREVKSFKTTFERLVNDPGVRVAASTQRKAGELVARSTAAGDALDLSELRDLIKDIRPSYPRGSGGESGGGRVSGGESGGGGRVGGGEY